MSTRLKHTEGSTDLHVLNVLDLAALLPSGQLGVAEDAGDEGLPGDRHSHVGHDNLVSKILSEILDLAKRLGGNIYISAIKLQNIDGEKI